MICLVGNCIAAEGIRTDWKINDGDCKNCIKMPTDEPSNYDFAVYNNQLFLCDYRNSKIKIFAKDNQNVKDVKLVAKPEIVTIFGDKLYILLRNNCIGVYNIGQDSIAIIKLKDKLTELEYSLAFFIDSFLVFPLTKDQVTIKSDAKVYNIVNPQVYDIMYNFFDFSRMINIQSDVSFKHRPSRLIDLCGGNNTYLIFQSFESANSLDVSGYILVNRNDKSIRKLDPIPNQFGILIHSNAGRGMKIFNDRIYLISELIGEGENAVIIGSYPLN
jgi:hypothetical protein